MKKTIKILISVLLLTLLCASLVGCKQLDDLKKQHAIFTDATKEEIILRGQTYKKVLERTMYKNEEWESFLIADEWSLSVTDKEVPVLLASQYGETLRYNSRGEEDPVILSRYHEVEEIFYCREDYLDTLKTKLDNAELDHFYYNKMMYSEEDHKMIYQKKLVSDKASKVIRNTLARPYNAATDLDPQNVYFEQSEFKDLRYTDKDLLLTNDLNLEVCKMGNGEYYIYGAYSDGTSVTNDLYWKKVAPEDNAFLDELFFPDYVETLFPEEVAH